MVGRALHATLNPTRAGWRLWGPVAVWMAVIFAASSIPNPPPPPAGITDKTQHIVVYAVLGALALRAFASGTWPGVTVTTSALAILLCGAYGATDEWHQRFVAGRTPEGIDVIADVVGAAAAVAIAGAIKKIRR